MRTKPNKNTMSIKIRNPFNILLFLFQTLFLLKKREEKLVKSQKLVLGWQQNVYISYMQACVLFFFLLVSCGHSVEILEFFLPLRFYVKTEVRDFGASKIAIFLSILKLMNFDFSKMFPLFKAEIY